MKIHLSSDGTPTSTRVILVDDTGHRLDLSRLVRAVTWHLDDKGSGAKVLLQCEGEMSADVQALLGLATQEQVNEEDARLMLMEYPG
jgi:hypothetical protein